MTRERYSQWIAVWRWFKEQPRSSGLKRLYNTLNEMWQQERAACPPGQLMAYSQPLENDPDFQEFFDDLSSPIHETSR